MEFLTDVATAAFLFVLILLPRAVDVYLERNGLKPEQYDYS